MDQFVNQQSVVRKIWGKGDTVLFIFAGASAEFALNKAVDWLYYTGRLPADPLGRLFSTMAYAQRIVFTEHEEALQAIDSINHIHGALEKSRGYKIPAWAYRDVLYMLIHYSCAAFELLERKMTDAEKDDLYDVFYRMGTRMGLEDLPATYSGWLTDRDQHLKDDLAYSDYTADLFRQYKKHLGGFRYMLLRQSQKMVVPARAKKLLGLSGFSWLRPVLAVYKMSRAVKLDWFLKSLVLPAAYKNQVREIDVPGH